MFKKVFRTVLTLVYSCFLLGSAVVAWDFTQHWKSAEGEYGVGDYVTYVNDRYGDDARLYSDTAIDVAKTGWDQAKLLAETTGVNDMLTEATAQDTDQDAKAVVAEVPPSEAGDEPEAEEVIILAATNEIAAPETSLFPKARATAEN